MSVNYTNHQNPSLTIQAPILHLPGGEAFGATTPLSVSRWPSCEGVGDIRVTGPPNSKSLRPWGRLVGGALRRHSWDLGLTVEGGMVGLQARRLGHQSRPLFLFWGLESLRSPFKPKRVPFSFLGSSWVWKRS